MDLTLQTNLRACHQNRLNQWLAWGRLYRLTSVVWLLVVTFCGPNSLLYGQASSAPPSKDSASAGSSRIAAMGSSSPGSLDVASMIGALGSPQAIFSRLEVQDRFESQAVLVQDPDLPRSEKADGLPLWYEKSYCWHSPTYFHEPLYFEQPNLERYGLGRSRWTQPLWSAAHFYSSIALVPYKTLTHHPHERVYTLGNLRPGNCVARQGRVLIGQSCPGELFYYWQADSGY